MLKSITIALAIMCGTIFISAESYRAGLNSNLDVIDRLHSQINVITDEYEYKLDELNQEIITCVPATGWEITIPSFQTHTNESLRM